MERASGCKCVWFVRLRFVHRCRYTFQTTMFKPIKFANLGINLSTSFLGVYCVRCLLSFLYEKGLPKNRVQIKVSNYLRSRIPSLHRLYGPHRLHGLLQGEAARLTSPRAAAPAPPPFFKNCSLHRLHGLHGLSQVFSESSSAKLPDFDSYLLSETPTSIGFCLQEDLARFAKIREFTTLS